MHKFFLKQGGVVENVGKKHLPLKNGAKKREKVNILEHLGYGCWKSFGLRKN